MKRFYLLLLLALALLASAPGCGVRSQGARGVTEDYFFPRAPDPQRVQFLRSYAGSADFKQSHPLLEYLAGAEDTPEYEIEKPFSVAATKGRIYSTDSFGLQGVNVLDLENRRFYVLGKTKGPGELKKPIHIFADPEGFKYVSDLNRRQVCLFGPDETYIRAYGDGASFVPVSCVAFGKEVYILDMQKDTLLSTTPEGEPEEVRRDQILVLDKETGKPLRRIGRHGSDREGFAFASFLAVDRLGYLYVADFLNHRVVKLDSRGNVLLTFGRHGDRAGDFSKMKGIALDRKGLIYVVDAAFQAVQVFDNSGQALFAMGGPDAPVGAMDLPAGIWIDYDNLDRFRDLYAPDFTPEYLIIVANQLSPQNKVAVYAYGKRQGAEYPSEEKIVTLESQPAKPLWQLPVLPGEPAPPKAEPLPPPPAPQPTEGGLSSQSTPR